MINFNSYSDFSYCRSCARTHSLNWQPVNKNDSEPITAVGEVYNYFGNCSASGEPIFATIIDNNWIGISRCSDEQQERVVEAAQRCLLCNKNHIKIIHSLTYDHDMFYYTCPNNQAPVLLEQATLKIWMEMPRRAKFFRDGGKRRAEEMKPSEETPEKKVMAPL